MGRKDGGVERSADYRVTAAQISVIGGVRRDDWPGFGVARSRSFWRQRSGELYVVAEADSPQGEDACRLVANTIVAEYPQHRSRSVTSAMMRALRAANRRLFEENAKSLPEHRQRVRACCAAIKGAGIYFGSVGPFVIAMVRDGAMDWVNRGPLGGEIGLPDEALGLAREIEVAFSSRPLPEATTIILCSAGAAGLASRETLSEALAESNPIAVIGNLYYLYQTSTTPRPFLALALRLESALQREAASWLPAPEGEESAVRFPQPVAAPSGKPRAFPEARRRPPEIPVAEGQGRAGDRFVTTLTASSQWLRHMPGLLTSFPPKLVWVAVLVIALLVLGVSLPGLQPVRDAFGSLGSPWERQVAEEVAPLPTKTPSSSAYTAGVETPAPPTSSVGRYQPAQAEKRTVNLTTATLLVDLRDELRSGDPTKLVVEEGYIYLLDRKAGRIYGYQLNTGSKGVQAATVILRTGDRVGSAAVGGLVAIAWAPAGGQRQRGALLCLDENGILMEYLPGQGLSLLLLYGGDAWGSVQAMAGYAGHLYLLDAKGNRLQWFPPSPDGYDKAAYDYWDPGVTVDLATAVDMAVDGSVYILRADGQIEKFYAGKPQPFGPTLLDVPLRRPVSLFVGTRSGSLYVADAANKRIVQLDAEGRYQREFRYRGTEDIFWSLRSVVVNEQEGVLYVLSGRGIYMVDMEMGR